MDVLNPRAGPAGTPASGAAKLRRWLWGLIALTLVARVATLGAYPLMDNTEARYAEIARKMLETGDWLMPQFHYGIAFWSKPPLAIWLTATSFAAFGINEFASRLPALLCCVAIAFLAWMLARRAEGPDVAVKAVAVLVTTTLFFVAAGAVMTDAELALGTTLSMVAFREAMCQRGPRGLLWGYAFFVGLAIGLMAKGPVAVVLAGVPVAAWTAWRREVSVVVSRLPWVTGIVLFAILVVPWYWLAELRTPGFLDYFLIGEHWKRYTVSGWSGDMFGTAHATPRGTIWPLAIVCTLPWCAVWAVLTWSRRRAGDRPPTRDGTGLRAYLWLWMLTPPLFFTVAGNILFTYILPGLPAFALLVAQAWDGLLETTPWRRSVKYHPLIIPVGVVIAVLLIVPRLAPSYTQQTLVQRYLAARTDSSQRLIYLRETPHSAEFYARGKVVTAPSAADLLRYLDEGRHDFFVVKQSDLESLPAGFERATEIARAGKFHLLVR